MNVYERIFYIFGIFVVGMFIGSEVRGVKDYRLGQTQCERILDDAWIKSSVEFTYNNCRVIRDRDFCEHLTMEKIAAQKAKQTDCFQLLNERDK